MQTSLPDGDPLAISLYCKHVASKELYGRPITWDDPIWEMLAEKPQTREIVGKFAEDLSNFLNMGLDEIGLSTRVRRALRNNETFRLNQVVELISSETLERVPSIGKLAAAEIRERVKVVFDEAPAPLRNPYRGLHEQA